MRKSEMCSKKAQEPFGFYLSRSAETGIPARSCEACLVNQERFFQIGGKDGSGNPPRQY